MQEACLSLIFIEIPLKTKVTIPLNNSNAIEFASLLLFVLALKTHNPRRNIIVK